MKDPTRQPARAPFPVGALIRYVGDRRSFVDAAGTIPLLVAGMEFTVIAATAGSRGTGKPIDPDDEDVVDATHDGRSVYLNRRGERRSVLDVAEWKLLSVELVRWNTRGTGGPWHVAAGPKTVCGRRVPEGAQRTRGTPAEAGCRSCERGA